MGYIKPLSNFLSNKIEQTIIVSFSVYKMPTQTKELVDRLMNKNLSYLLTTTKVTFLKTGHIYCRMKCIHKRTYVVWYILGLRKTVWEDKQPARYYPTTNQSYKHIWKWTKLEAYLTWDQSFDNHFVLHDDISKSTDTRTCCFLKTIHELKELSPLGDTVAVEILLALDRIGSEHFIKYSLFDKEQKKNTKI